MAAKTAKEKAAEKAAKVAAAKEKAVVAAAKEKAAEVVAAAIICPSCKQNTMVGANTRIGREVKFMLSNYISRMKHEYHKNRLGQMYFQCFRCDEPIYLKNGVPEGFKE